MNRAALLLAACLAAGEAAAETCLMPLEGGAPVNEVEERQPYTIISESGTIEGFPFVLAGPYNRERPDLQFYTVRGMRFEPLGAAFPRGALWSTDTTPPRADGSVYGWPTVGGPIYRLTPGAEVFEPVPGTEGYTRVQYDPAEDRLTMLRDGRLSDVSSSGITRSVLGGFTRAGPMADPSYFPERFTLPRFFPSLGVYLAADETDDTIWARTADGLWSQLDLGGPVHQAWGVANAQWHEDPVDGTVTFPIYGTALVFDTRAQDAPRLLYRLSYAQAAFLPDGPPLVWERAPDPPGVLARLLGAKPSSQVPLRHVQLLRDGPSSPPGESVVLTPAEYDKRRPPGIPYVAYTVLPEVGAVLVRHAGGVSVYDGGRVSPAPQLGPDRIGTAFWVVRFGGRVFLRASDGLYELGPDLAPIERPLPFAASGGWEVLPSAAFGGAILWDRTDGRAWITPDGQSFEPVRNLTGNRLRAVGSDLPDRRAVLAATDGGAALIADRP